jgi:cell division protein FtsB
MITKINKAALEEKMKNFSDVRVIGLLAFGLVVILVSWSIVNVLEVNYELEKQRADLEQKNQIEKLQNENLNLQNVYFQSDEYLELSARRQLNKAAPGEKLYLIPRSVAMANTVGLPKSQRQLEQEKEQKKSKFSQNLEAWKKFLFHGGTTD